MKVNVHGVHNFLKKLWDLVHDDKNCFLVSNDQPSDEELNTIHLTINKINEDLKRFSFNTIVSSMKKFEDTLVDGLMSGKFAFKDFANFVIKELVRIVEETLKSKKNFLKKI